MSIGKTSEGKMHHGVFVLWDAARKKTRVVGSGRAFDLPDIRDGVRDACKMGMPLRDALNMYVERILDADSRYPAEYAFFTGVLESMEEDIWCALPVQKAGENQYLFIQYLGEQSYIYRVYSTDFEELSAGWSHSDSLSTATSQIINTLELKRDWPGFTYHPHASVATIETVMHEYLVEKLPELMDTEIANGDVIEAVIGDERKQGTLLGSDAADTSFILQYFQFATYVVTEARAMGITLREPGEIAVAMMADMVYRKLGGNKTVEKLKSDGNTVTLTLGMIQEIYNRITPLARKEERCR